jgi:protein gp37
MSNRMGRSRIGYMGIGADSRPVDWYYGWNPGGLGCSNGCDGCWSQELSSRFGSVYGCKKCARFEVHLHEERLCQPANTKKPGLVLVNFTCDTFDPWRSGHDVQSILSAAHAAPCHSYVWLTQQPDWMEQQTRPEALNERLPRNWYMGLTIRNQAEADARLAILLQIRGKLWISYEPAWKPVDFFGENLEALAGVIIGHDNRREALGSDTLYHIRSVAEQCQAAAVNVFVKQIWLKGRFLRANLPEEFAKFPDDLKLNTLPWSAP